MEAAEKVSPVLAGTSKDINTVPLARTRKRNGRIFGLRLGGVQADRKIDKWWSDKVGRTLH